MLGRGSHLRFLNNLNATGQIPYVCYTTKCCHVKFTFAIYNSDRGDTLLQDQDVLHSWLMDLHFEEYFPLFASAGYDMPTICRMTPEVGSCCAESKI